MFIFIVGVDAHLSGKISPTQVRHGRNHEVGAVAAESQGDAPGNIRTESDSLGDLISRLNRVLARNPLQDSDGSIGTAPPKYEDM